MPTAQNQFNSRYYYNSNAIVYAKKNTALFCKKALYKYKRKKIQE